MLKLTSLCCGLTLQGKDPAPQRVHDAQQGHLVRHVEEVVLDGLAGDGPNLVDELLDLCFTFVLAIIIAQNLKTTE